MASSVSDDDEWALDAAARVNALLDGEYTPSELARELRNGQVLAHLCNSCLYVNGLDGVPVTDKASRDAMRDNAKNYVEASRRLGVPSELQVSSLTWWDGSQDLLLMRNVRYLAKQLDPDFEGLNSKPASRRSSTIELGSSASENKPSLPPRPQLHVRANARKIAEKAAHKESTAPVQRSASASSQESVNSTASSGASRSSRPPPPNRKPPTAKASEGADDAASATTSDLPQRGRSASGRSNPPPPPRKPASDSQGTGASAKAPPVPSKTKPSRPPPPAIVTRPSRSASLPPKPPPPSKPAALQAAVARRASDAPSVRNSKPSNAAAKRNSAAPSVTYTSQDNRRSVPSPLGSADADRSRSDSAGVKRVAQSSIPPPPPPKTQRQKAATDTAAASSSSQSEQVSPRPRPKPSPRGTSKSPTSAQRDSTTSPTGGAKPKPRPRSSSDGRSPTSPTSPTFPARAVSPRSKSMVGSPRHSPTHGASPSPVAKPRPVVPRAKAAAKPKESLDDSRPAEKAASPSSKPVLDPSSELRTSSFVSNLQASLARRQAENKEASASLSNSLADSTASTQSAPEIDMSRRLRKRVSSQEEGLQAVLSELTESSGEDMNSKRQKLKTLDTFKQVEGLAQQMKAELCSTHTYKLKRFVKSFSGREAVHWLTDRGYCRDNNEAVALCRRMMAYNMFVHVTDATMGFYKSKSHMPRQAPTLYRWMDAMLWGEDGGHSFAPSQEQQPQQNSDKAVDGDQISHKSESAADDDDYIDMEGPDNPVPPDDVESRRKLAKKRLKLGSLFSNFGRTAASKREAKATSEEAASISTTAVPASPILEASETESDFDDDDDDFDDDDYIEMADEAAVDTSNANNGSSASQSHINVSVEEHLYEDADVVRQMRVKAAEKRVSRQQSASESDEKTDAASSAASDLPERTSSNASAKQGQPSRKPKPPLKPKPAALSGKSLTLASRKEGYDDSDIYESISSIRSKMKDEYTDAVDDEVKRETSRKQDSLRRFREVAMDVSSIYATPFESGESSSSGLAEESSPPPALSPTLSSDSLTLMTTSGQHVAVKQTLIEPASPTSRFWSGRPDVIAAGLLSQLDKKSIKRQEAIHEVALSEEAYSNDLDVLDTIFARELAARAPPLIPAELASDWQKSIRLLREVSSSLLNALHERQETSLEVERIGDILLQKQVELRQAFEEYSSVAVCVRDELDMKSDDAGAKDFLRELSSRPKARQLQVDAFLLSPVQRVARLPLLIKAVIEATPEDHIDASELSQASQAFTATVQRCNEHMRVAEEYLELRRLQAQLDFSRLEEEINLVSPTRKIVKQSALDLVTFGNTSNRKITKSKTVEVILLSDSFLYAKPVKVKRTGKLKFIVYKIVHRSQITAIKAGNAEGSKNAFLFEVVVQDEHLTFKTDSSDEREAWIQAVNDQGQEDEYAVWQCPKVRAKYDYERQTDDELALKVGDVISVVQRGQPGGWSRGRYAHLPDNPTVNPVCWYPTDYVEAIEEQRRETGISRFDKWYTDFNQASFA